MQKPEGAAVTSLQAPLAATRARVVQALGPEARGPPTPGRGPTEPRAPGSAKQPLRMSRCIPERPAQNTNALAAEGINHQQGVWWGEIGDLLRLVVSLCQNKKDLIADTGLTDSEKWESL